MSLVVRVLYAENRDWPKFDAFVRERLSALLPTLTFPSDGTVFDYFIDPQRAVCVRWNERSLEKLRYVAVSSSYVVIPEVLLFTVIFYNWYLQQFKKNFLVVAKDSQLHDLQLRRFCVWNSVFRLSICLKCFFFTLGGISLLYGSKSVLAALKNILDFILSLHCITKTLNCHLYIGTCMIVFVPTQHASMLSECG